MFSLAHTQIKKLNIKLIIIVLKSGINFSLAQSIKIKKSQFISLEKFFLYQKFYLINLIPHSSIPLRPNGLKCP